MTREYVGQSGLKVNVDDPYFAFSRLAQITQTPKIFDFPGDDWPPHFHHTGPLHDGRGHIPIAFPWERLTGTHDLGFHGHSEQRFRVIVLSRHRSLRPRVSAGRQLVLSVGGNVDPAKLGTLSSNTIIVAHAPQLELLQKAALCITHAGQNTVLESLAKGVPVVRYSGR